MHEWQDASDCTVALGNEIMGVQTKAVAEYSSPAEAVEEGGLGRREHKGIPSGAILIARITDRGATARYLQPRVHQDAQCPKVRRMPMIVVKSVNVPFVTDGTLGTISPLD